MKKQLEDLAQEMILEVKNLKDFAKVEMPEVVKEYIRYNIINDLMWFSFWLCVTIGLFITAYIGRSSHDDTFSLTTIICLTSSLLSILFSGICLDSFLSFKLQPRRKAIEAITSLLRTE